jgi:hypothetical protein
MAQLKVEDGLNNYVDTDTFLFKDAGKDDVIRFEFNFKGSPDEIHYIDPGCGCTKSWYENGKIVGTLDINKTGQIVKGKNAINKIVTVMLDPEVHYFTGGSRKERIINDNKRYLRLNLAGTAIGTE